MIEYSSIRKDIIGNANESSSYYDLKENLATVKINIKNKKKAIAQLEQEIVDEEGNI